MNPVMVGFNVILPEIGITWIGNFTWRTALMNSVDEKRPTQVWAVPFDKGPDEQRAWPRKQCTSLSVPYTTKLLWLIPATADCLRLISRIFRLHHRPGTSGSPGTFEVCSSGLRLGDWTLLQASRVRHSLPLLMCQPGRLNHCWVLSNSDARQLLWLF